MSALLVTRCATHGVKVTGDERSQLVDCEPCKLVVIRAEIMGRAS